MHCLLIQVTNAVRKTDTFFVYSQVRCEILEALLSLMANDFASRKVFLNRRGVQTVAGYLVPWLAEGGEDAPGELVQRSIVFLGVLIKHVLPSQDQDNSGLTQEGENLARLATETLAATIGAETTLEILEAAEDLQDEQNFADGEGDYFSGDEGEGGNTGGGGLGSLRVRTAVRDCPYSSCEGSVTSALTVYVIHMARETDPFFCTVPGVAAKRDRK